MYRIFICLLISTNSIVAFSQTELNGTAAVGNAESTFSVLYGKDWDLWKKKKFGVGVGVRFTSYVGANQYYTTAPAKLTSGQTGLSVIFTEDIVENIDTFLIKSPQVNSLNLMINLRYKVTDKFLIGFNIDAIGFSFGGNKDGTYFGNGGTVAATKAKPTSFNLLLISDNDLGTLNSEFFAQYNFNKKWSGKIGFQFLFTEYTTNTKVQTAPNGEKNDRFRNKAGQISIGTTYQF